MDRKYLIKAGVGVLVAMAATAYLWTFLFGYAVAYTGNQREYEAIGSLAFLVPHVVAALAIGIVVAIPFGILFRSHTGWLALLAVAPVVGIWITYYVTKPVSGSDLYSNTLVDVLGIAILVASFVSFALLGAIARTRNRSSGKAGT